MDVTGHGHEKRYVHTASEMMFFQFYGVEVIEK